MRVAIEQDSPRVIGVRLEGRLSHADWQAALKDVARHLVPERQSSILIDANAFEGFEPGEWDDLWFQLKHDAWISRIAIVGPPQWEDRILMFAGQGLRPMEIRYFTPTQAQQARDWAAAGEHAEAGEP